MNLAEIEAFLVLAEELHFARTAERLFLSPSRVSKLVSSLEHEVGGPLFERTTRRVTLTPVGAALVEQLRPGYAQMRSALAAAQRTARAPAGSLRIGFTVHTGGEALAGMIRRLENHYPDCDAILKEVPSVDPYSPLRRGEIDVLVNWGLVDQPDLTAGPVIDCQDRALAVGSEHRLSRRSSVSVEDLGIEIVPGVPTDYPAALEEAFCPPRTPSGQAIRRTRDVHTINEVRTLVASGRIVWPTEASMAGFLRRDDIILVPISDLPPTPVSLIWCTAKENAGIRDVATVAEQPDSAS